jgi:archaellum component FlaC
MTRFEQKKLDVEFNKFTRMNFDKPQKCKSIGQIRYYIQELSHKINDLQSSFNYVPSSAHALLSQYNAAQNRLIYRNFQEVYR